MNKDDYRQAIKIGRKIAYIFNLPCIFSCHKDDEGNPVFLLNDWDDNGNYIEARIGDWLCEDHEGRWHVLTDTEYKSQRSHDRNIKPTLRHARGEAAVCARHST